MSGNFGEHHGLGRKLCIGDGAALGEAREMPRVQRSNNFELAATPLLVSSS